MAHRWRENVKIVPPALTDEMLNLLYNIEAVEDE